MTLRFTNVLLVSLIVLPLILLSLWGCQKRDSLYGSENKIIVIADDVDWAVVEDIAKKTFEKEYNTPQPEKVFTLQKIAPEDLDSFTKWRNICLAATLQTGGEVGKILNSMLTERDRHRVENDSSYVFRKKDPWSKDQLLLVVVAKDTATLQERFKKHHELLFALFDQHASELAAKTIEPDAKSQELAKSLAQQYGWTLRIQRDFFEATNSAQDRFVWLRRLNPQRWVFVHWLETDDPSILSKEWIIQTRNRLAAIYYSGDVVVDKFTKEQEVDFLGKYALRLDGHWENNELNVGGAFRSYGFYDESSSRLYLIDLSVLAPGERKLPFIRQLDAMAHTFKIVEPAHS